MRRFHPLAALLVLGLLGACQAPMPSAPAPTPGPAAAVPVSAGGAGATLNRLRAEAGAGALQAHPGLMAAAQGYAASLAASGQRSHGAGGSLTTRARAAGCAGGAMAENLGWGTSSAEGALSMWMTSAPHRANMLGRGYTAYGLGGAGDVWVLMLADRC